MSSSSQAKILACARDIFLQKGLKGLSMRAVAAKAGITATAIYRHYVNREDLIYHVILEGHKVFVTYMYASLEGRDPEERLGLCGKAYVQFALEQPKYYEMIFLTAIPLGKSPIPVELERKDRASYQFLLDRVQECLDAKVLKPDDAKEVALTIWATCHGLITLWLRQNLELDAAQFMRLYQGSTARLFIGLAAPRRT
jgi:AcrR family transcriptional regulator